MHEFFVIGHRGAAGEKLENSLSGFKHALNLDIDAIELDVRQHSGELWVIHDNDLKRLTGSSGNFDGSGDPAQLRLLNGEPIPKLSEVLDLYWGQMPVNIEIKSFDTAALLLELLDKYPVIDEQSQFPWILISSFDHQQMVDLRKLSSRWQLAPIITGIPINCDQLINDIRPYSIHFNIAYIDLAVINQIQERDVRVMVFTVNEADQATSLKNAGINGIITDFPSQLLDIK
jgi:glycerophosphoryl diester phosphodiesterase